MTCPKDADGGNDEGMCHNRMNHLVCTRRKGHKGNHHAHGTGRRCCDVWTIEESVVEAL